VCGTSEMALELLLLARTVRQLSVGILFCAIAALASPSARDVRGSPRSNANANGDGQTYQSLLKASGIVHTAGGAENSGPMGLTVLQASSKDLGIRPPVIIEDTLPDQKMIHKLLTTMTQFTTRSSSKNTKPAQAELSQDLPKGWTSVPDPASGLFYYWNSQTNEVSWNKPTVPEQKAPVPQTQSKALPEGWQSIVDPVSGYLYYWNKYTNEVTWEISEGSASNSPSVVPVAQQNTNELMPQGTLVDPSDLPDGWKSFKDSKSKAVFYWNVFTSEAWRAIFNEASGMFYYWNPATGETTFSVPASLTKPKSEEISFQLPPGTVIDMSSLEKTLSDTPTTKESAPSSYQKSFVSSTAEKYGTTPAQKTIVPPAQSVPVPPDFNELWNEVLLPSKPATLHLKGSEQSQTVETSTEQTPEQTEESNFEAPKVLQQPSFEAPSSKSPTGLTQSEPNVETSSFQTDQSKNTLDLEKLKERETLLSNRDSGVLPGFGSSTLSSVTSSAEQDVDVKPTTNNLGLTNKEAALQALKLKDMLKSMDPSSPQTKKKLATNDPPAAGISNHVIASTGSQNWLSSPMSLSQVRTESSISGPEDSSLKTAFAVVSLVVLAVLVALVAVTRRRWRENVFPI